MRVRGLGVAVAVAGTVAAGLLFACGLNSGGTYAGGGVDASIDQTTRDAPPADNYVGPDAFDGNIGVFDSGDAGFDAGCGECQGACCNGVCLAGTPNCNSCGGQNILCPFEPGFTNAGNCMSSCAACPTGSWALGNVCYASCESVNAFECVPQNNCVTDCNQCGDGGEFGCTFCSDGGLPVQARCEPNPSNCPDQNYQPSGAVCLCPSGDAGDCYGASQVCVALGGPIGATACLTCGESGNGGPDTTTGNNGCKGGGTCQKQGAGGVCQ